MAAGADGADGPAEMMEPLNAVEPPGVAAPAASAGGIAAGPGVPS